MKKEYMKPTTIVVKRKVNHYLMSGSPYTDTVSVSSEDYDENKMTDL